MILSPRQRHELDEATAFYAAQMPQQLLDYLAARGIDQRAASGARLGWVGEPLVGHEQFQGRLAIPYIANDHCVSLKFRAAPDQGGAKYLGLPAQHPRLYGVDSLRLGGSTVAIVEGELDAIVMTYTVGIPAVGIPGVGTWLKHMPRCFADVERVLVVCDNDTANEDNPGQRLAKKIAGDIRGAKIIAPPDDHDLTDWVVRDGVDVVRKSLGVEAT
jgi:DNA primase